MTKSIMDSVKNRIIKHGRGWCFTPRHFLDLESDTGVRSALSRLEKDKFIRRLAQGLYDYPNEHPTLGMIPPKVEAIAQAISEKNGVLIQPSGAYAANLIGLSEQVPGRIVFLTNGPSKKIKIGNQKILFRTTTEKNMYPAGTKTGLVIQALRNLGINNIDHIAHAKVKKFLTGTDRNELVKSLKYAPQWIRKLILALMDIKP
ncbi:MAG TPA: DUF6088 family protein [Gammaproteobacteria bacterium]|nr:DUF6088 family protein [Gammaproteobacteria bacterium]